MTWNIPVGAVTMRITTLALSVVATACAMQDLPTAPHPAAPTAKAGLVIALDRKNPSLVRGIVVSDSGVPLIGANVAIDAINASVGTDKTGAFLIKSPREGTFLLRVRAIGYAPATQTVTIAADAGLWINATLKVERWQSACNLVITGVGVAVRVKDP